MVVGISRSFVVAGNFTMIMGPGGTHVTYYGGKEMAASFRQVRSNTITIAEEIPENKYEFKAAPDTRSVAQMLVHIALGPTFQLEMHQGRFDDLKNVNFPALWQKVMSEEAKPRTKADIIAMLKWEGEKFAAYLEGLTESFLAERVTMPASAQPSSKSRFEMLLSPKEHEMHHRGQLMVMQRMIGLKPHLTRQMEERIAQRAAQAQR
jgi:uncharacterized damage-inducible protein DinB